MNQTKNLRLPEKERPYGLYLFCNGCKNLYSNEKKVKCKCGKLVYKAQIHIPGTGKQVKPMILETDNFHEAVQLFYNFKNELKRNSFQKISIKKEDSTPTRLIECFAYYMGYLNNVGVPSHKQKTRAPKYISKYDHLFEQYKDALADNGVDWKILKFIEVNDQMIGFIHDYFLVKHGYANKTYNNNMGLLSAFTTHVINKFKLDYQNPFLGVPDMVVTPKVKAIGEHEFTNLLNLITPENGIQMKTLKTRKNQKKVNHFKPWLKYAFKLGLFTGGRSEDIVELKWSDIRLQEDGKFDTLETIDHKIDSANSHRISETDRITKCFAITQELGELLLEMGYEKYKGTSKYIIAPEDGLKRSNVAGIISRSFSHYYSLLNTGKAITFRNLRKTFMTSAYKEFGLASTALTNHKSPSMTDKHYYDKEVTRDEAKENFSVFKKKKNS
ncbi:MAG: hypothetical protein KF900_11765 [Bacteroidetes bacterium]|nr:hypothetical protein [Bacteroidota bacterium]